MIALDEPTDQDLLQRTHGGDPAAFQQLYLRHVDTIFRFAYRMLGSQENAEDVTHDCFLALIRNPRRFDSRRGALRTYLYIAVRNLILKRLRRPGSEPPSEHEIENLPEDTDKEPLPRLLAGELSGKIRRAIGMMPPLQREVLVLFEYEEETFAQIAAIVGTDVGTVKSRLHRARAWLRREMAPYMNRVPGKR
jgi:RNA polymerase sigma-70 factor (ECF subfamily)